MQVAQPQQRPPRRRLWSRLRKRADPEATFLEHLPLIERVAESACRRAGLPPQDVEEFVGQVRLKLIDDDYAVLRKHRGDSKLTTYLTTVVNNQFKDFCNHKWGKFRHSAAAIQIGPVAKALERLLVIDRHDLQTAIEILKTNHRVETSRQELQDIATRFPQRKPRVFLEEEVLEQEASEAPEADAERRVVDEERSERADRVEEALNLALRTLDPQELLILKMFYRDGLTVAAIAAALRQRARLLYSRKDKAHAKLLAAFKAEGLTWQEVQDILGWQEREIRADFGQRTDHETDDQNHDGMSV